MIIEFIISCWLDPNYYNYKFIITRYFFFFNPILLPENRKKLVHPAEAEASVFN